MNRRRRKAKGRGKVVSVHTVCDIRDRYGDMPKGSHVAPMEVDDPNSPPGQIDKIVVMRTIRDDPLGEMHAAKRIDDAEFLAGRKWQADYERVCLGSLRGVNLANDPVQGGGAPDAFSLVRAQAAQRLKEAASELGREGNIVIHDILADGLSILGVCRKRGNASGYQQSVVSTLFHKSLGILVVFYELASPETLAA